MSNRAHDKTRRRFLTHSGKLALAAGAATAATHLAGRSVEAQSTRTPVRKKIIPGSPRRTYSRAVRLDRLVFVAGCVGSDDKGTIAGDFEVQAAQALLNLKASIEASGSNLSQVLKCTCFLKNVQHFAKFNEVYLKFFPSEPPARSTVVVKDLVAPGALLEIDCVCHVG